MLRRFICMAICFSVACSTTAAEYKDANWVSIIALIATPDRFHGKPVHVTGLATIAFENTALCIGQPPLSTKDCVWLDVASVDAKVLERWQTYHDQIISITGIFDKENSGHLDAYSGSISNISKVFVRQRPQ